MPGEQRRHGQIGRCAWVKSALFERLVEGHQGRDHRVRRLARGEARLDGGGLLAHERRARGAEFALDQRIGEVGEKAEIDARDGPRPVAPALAAL